MGNIGSHVDLTSGSSLTSSREPTSAGGAFQPPGNWSVLGAPTSVAKDDLGLEEAFRESRRVRAQVDRLASRLIKGSAA